MKISLARIFLRQSEIEFNYKKILSLYDRAVKNNVDLLVCPEMSVVGGQVYDNFLEKNFIKKSDEFVERIVDYTQGKRTRILLGCPYFIDGTVKDGIIKQPELYNSMVLINGGYIDAIASKTTVSKSNIFDEYKYFDKDPVLKSVVYENDNFDILNSDDIAENKNIFFIKERDTDFVVCVDTEIKKNINSKKNQLIKIAKWTGKNVIYLNAFYYDIKNNYRISGEMFVIDSLGNVSYSNTSYEEGICTLKSSVVDGKIGFEVLNDIVGSSDFLQTLANNYTDKTIIYEVRDKQDSYADGITYITFDKSLANKKVKYLDFSQYVDINRIKTVSQKLKDVIVDSVFGDCIYIPHKENS